MTTSTDRGAATDRWRRDAACVGQPPERFTGPHQPGDVARAIDTCRTCPVRAPCLATALTIDAQADIGIWGGTTPETRALLRRTGGPDLAEAHQAAAAYEITVDDHGDLHDETGRITITELPTGGHLALIDDHPIARTDDLAQALTSAAAALDTPPHQMPRRPAPPMVTIQDDGHGGHTDPTGRITIVPGPRPEQYLVFLDQRFQQQEPTLNRARAAAHHVLHEQAPPLTVKIAQRAGHC